MSVVSRLLVFGAVATQGLAQSSLPWVVYYSDKEPVEAFAPYRLLVLDSHYHPPLEPLAQQGKVLLGYISLGEVERERPWYAAVKSEGILLGENPNWKGSFYVDVRDPRWSRRVLDDLIPSILKRGFHGLFLDTLDNPGFLEDQKSFRFRGMRNAAADLIRQIRARFPEVRIMLNRAYDLLPEVAAKIDMELGESVYADFDFDSKRNRLVRPDVYRAQVEILKAARERNPKLEIFTLDYWNPEDSQGVARIYQEQRANGFHPYVATVDLDRIVPEPRP